MHFPLNRPAAFCALLLFALLPARGGVVPLVTGTSVPPVFLTGTAAGDANPYYGDTGDFTSVPVGKSLVVPIVVSGSGPMTYTATSSSAAIEPIVKTGYPVMNIQVSYSGTTAISGTSLYSFRGGSDGGYPYSGLMVGANGELYGTTETGSNNAGTIFEITTSGSLATLYSFTGGDDGGNPYAGLVTGTDGNFYGTTSKGGAGGAGTVYQLTTSSTFATLYPFTGGTDGGTPYAALVAGTNGNLYGTTSAGGAYSAGTVFEITTGGSLTRLHSFTGGADGGSPYAGLTTSTTGILYGTTTTSGTGGHGTVYQITSSGSLNTLHSFTGGNDGGYPGGTLVEGTNGNFYGTTEEDGTGGHGTVFEITTGGSLTTLHAFTGGADGGKPSAGLILASDGNFYGTTETGGSGNGTIFQVTTSGSLTTVHTFAGGSDGANPYSGLAQTATGDLYGTTETDGSNGHGTVFQLDVVSSAPFSGTMSFALLRDMAPVTTGYIAGLAEAGYYNGLDFFRITNLGNDGEDEFIAQGGDPTETGTGSPGFSFDDELVPSLVFTGQGQLAMANAGIDQSTFRGTNGAQFFFTQSPIRSLDFNYTIFGQLLQGFDVMQEVLAVTTGTDGSTPSVPVVMKSVTVSEDNTDAILLVNAAGYTGNGVTIKVNATDPSKNKAVVNTGATPSQGLTLNMATVNDTVNDPPIILHDPNVFTPLHQRVSLPIRGVDLEFDLLASGTEALSNSASAGFNLIGNTLLLTPNPFTPVGSVTAGLYVYESYNAGTPEAQTGVTVDLGSGNLTPLPALFQGAPGRAVAAGTSAFATGTAGIFGGFLDSKPGVGASNFTATINWGDGILTTGTGTFTTGTASVTSGSAAVVKSGYLPTAYGVSCPAGHVYSNPGIYPVNVAVTDSNGGILELQNTAVVTAGPIRAFGRTFTAARGTADCMVATFLDASLHVIPADYTAIINWGDGSVGNGLIRGSNGSFEVYGIHQYAAGTTYPVDVTINSRINSNTGYAWSIAKLSSVATHQPPFAQSHIIGQIGDPGYGNGLADEEVTLYNSGNIPSGPVTLRFYLSPDKGTDPISASAVPLQIGKGSTYNAISVPPGSAISGAVSEIVLPANSFGKYIIMQVITSDPVGSHMDYPRAFADPDPLF